MFIESKQVLKSILNRFKSRKIPISWVRKEETSWLAKILKASSFNSKKGSYSEQIERLAQQTNSLGRQPLWEGYAGNNIGGSARMPNEVRTAATIGDFYTYLVQKKKPRIIAEFGTAFGVSGMYFLAGLRANANGRLLTFEPNEVWAKLAEKNLARIYDQFVLTIGTFEENIDNVLPRGESIDLTFIDAIHTKEFVVSQLDIVVSKSSEKAVIILDDINFSESMKECWQTVSTDSRFAASATLGNRVGILERK